MAEGWWERCAWLVVNVVAERNAIFSVMLMMAELPFSAMELRELILVHEIKGDRVGILCANVVVTRSRAKGHSSRRSGYLI